VASNWPNRRVSAFAVAPGFFSFGGRRCCRPRIRTVRNVLAFGAAAYFRLFSRRSYDMRNAGSIGRGSARIILRRCHLLHVLVDICGTLFSGIACRLGSIRRARGFQRAMQTCGLALGQALSAIIVGIAPTRQLSTLA